MAHRNAFYSLLIVCLLAPASGLQAIRKHAVHESEAPVKTVNILLSKLKDQLIKEGTDEAAIYDKEACFCKEQRDERNYRINSLNTQLEKLEADIESETAALNTQTTESEEQHDEITAKTTLIETKETELEDKTTENNKMFSDHEIAISNIEDAIKVLKTSKSDTKKKSLLQLVAKNAKKAGISSEIIAAIADKPHSFTYSSDSIIATLEELRDTFAGRLDEAKKDHIDTVAGLNQEIKSARTQKEIATKRKADADRAVAEHTTKKAALEAEQEEATADKETEETTLATLTADCEEKQTTYFKESNDRADEINAISKAIAFLGSVNGAFEKTNAYATKNTGADLIPSFLQQASSTTSTYRVVDLLRSQGMQLKSSSLIALAAKISIASNSQDPFVKVKALIADLVSKLQTQMEDEAAAKESCDTRMNEQIEARNQATSAVETNNNLVATEKHNVKVAKAGKKKESDIILKNTKEQESLLEIKTSLTDSHKAAKQLAIQGAGDVEDAIDILKTVFGESSDSPRAAQGGKILALLDSILTEFHAQIVALEDQLSKDQNDYEAADGALSTENDAAGTRKDGHETDETNSAANLITAEGDLDDQKTAEKLAKESLDNLKGECVQSMESYGERKAAREKEIQALREAQTILRAASPK